MADHFKDATTTVDLAAVTDKLERQDRTEWTDTDASATTATTSTSPTRNRSTAFLDGLRGVACVMVYMSHHVPYFYGFDNQPDSLERGYGQPSRSFAQLPFVRVFFTGGSPAVAIFFVLSGYVLARSPLNILREGPGQTAKCYQALASATVRRPLRLFLPCAGVTLVFAAIMQLPFGLTPKMTWPVPEANVFLELVRWVCEFARIVNPFAPHGISERWFPYNPPMWTIGIEFRGSLLLFALVAAYARFSVWNRFLLFIGSGIILLFSYQWSMACFMAGIALVINDQEGYDSALYRRLSAQGRTIVPWAIFVVGWYLCSQPGGKRDPSMALDTWGWYYLTKLTPPNYLKLEFWRFWQACGAAMVVYAILKLPTLQSLLNTRVIRQLGRVSFALYLTHIPLLWVFSDRVYRIFGHATWEFDSWADNWLVIPDVGPRGLSTRFLVTQAVIFPLNFVVAHYVTVYMDEPSVRIGKWASDRVFGRKQATTTTMTTLPTTAEHTLTTVGGKEGAQS